MNDPRRALVLSGSPKLQKSASLALGNYLASCLEKEGVRTRVRSLPPGDSLLDEVRAADLLVLTCPLYADGIPARLKEALMQIAAAKTGPKYCAALVQCGFLESEQNDTALEMCRLFARDAGFVWLGGLGRGAGGMLANTTLEQAPPPMLATRKALDLAARQLSRGEPLSAEVVQAFRAAPLPRWLYVLAADGGFLLRLVKQRRLLRALARPYRKGGN